ncbi:hypothetical protein ABUE31_05390 [Mesorhizobium sp. ZMM04-5]|uniref:Flagellar biosynthesis protein FliO n=1 Tax=Mesorhizobium marinum TaxID=3228790 RepID=A0ABV3QX47_9HYPH
MSDWFAGVGGPGFATAVIWTLAALILLVIVLVVIRFVRSMTFGTFVAGGRNRKTRLAVMDATAVDSHRRLVLVRRDDIEHLLLIGGPTDVVVEREIRLSAGRRTQSVFGDSDVEEQVQALPPLPTAPPPAPRPRAPEPAQLPPLPIRGGAPQPARQPERVAHAQPPRLPERAPARQPAPRHTPARQPVREQAPMSRSPSARLPASSMAAAPLSPSRMSPAPAPVSELDDALLRELEVTFDPEPPKSMPQPVEMTLDDEMTKLLGELTSTKR